MNRQFNAKINYLLRNWPRGTVGVQPWLNSLGISRQLADGYCRSQWIKRIYSGAYILIDDQVDWEGAVYALQYQLHYKVHVAAKSALEIQGYGHYVPLGKDTSVWLFKSPDEKRLLPHWFQDQFASDNLHYVERKLFLDDDRLGLVELPVQDYHLKVAAPERALIECMDLAPRYLSLELCLLFMQSMMTLRPKLLQKLLEQCRSVKAKRLFLLLAEHENPPWFSKLDLNLISLGGGKRVLGGGGYYYKKYQLSLPLNLKDENNDDKDAR